MVGRARRLHGQHPDSLTAVRSQKMKLSSRVSALLVGLSVTAGSVSLTAPAAAADELPGTLVAQAEPAEESAAAGASGGSAAPQPAISIGTSTAPAGADTPSESAPETDAKPKPRPFAGSSLFLQNTMTTNTVFRGQTQYANPTVDSSLYLLPRYAINDDFQLRGRLIVSYEYTNHDSSKYRNEPLLSDTTLQLFYRSIPKFAGIQPAVAANIALPTSKSSRARTLLFNPGVTLQLFRPFEDVLSGSVAVIGTATYSHPIYRSQNPEVVDDRPYKLACVGGIDNCSDLLSGVMNASDTLSYAITVVGSWGKFSPAISYLGASQWLYQPTEVTNPIDGTPVGRPDGFEPSSVRQTHYLSVFLDYDINSWLTAEIGYYNSVSAIGGSGQRTNLLFDRYQDTRVFLGASVQLDNFVKTLEGGDKGEAGVVRAKSKGPIFTF